MNAFAIVCAAAVIFLAIHISSAGMISSIIKAAIRIANELYEIRKELHTINEKKEEQA